MRASRRSRRCGQRRLHWHGLLLRQRTSLLTRIDRRELIRGHFARLTEVVHHFRTHGGNALHRVIGETALKMGHDVRHLGWRNRHDDFAASLLQVAVAAEHLAFEPADFIQVNGSMNRLLIDQVLRLMALTPGSTVLDLFCGLGNFTLPLARRAARVVGIEGEAGLIERARANAMLNGITNAEFHVANLAGEEAVERCLALAGKGGYSHVLVDPPRTGALDVLPALARIAPQRLVYVSCHPGSLARDLGILVTQHGFTLQSAGIVDMFPHTSHVESVAVLDGPGARRR